MSSLWTPSGEHFPEKDGGEQAEKPKPTFNDLLPPETRSAPPGGPDAAAQAEVEAMRRQLAGTPAEVVVANHCYGLFELAAIYLSQSPPMLFQAQLAIDGLGHLLAGLKGRLGEAEPALLEALSQLRLAFVQIEGSERTASAEAAASAED